MTPAAGFVTFFVATLALLGGVVATGRRERRVAHLVLVACTFVALGVAIYHAERMGEQYDLDSAGAITPVHLALAKATAAAYVLPLVTGFLTIRDARHLVWHRRVAWAVLAATVATAVTGTWMVLAAEKLAP